MKRHTPLRRTPWRYRTPESHRNGEHIQRHRAWVEHVRERAAHRCERCSAAPNFSGFCPTGPLDPHHPWTRARGGWDAPWNGVLLCRTCHRAVHDHTIPDWPNWLASSEEGARLIRARLDA